MLADLDLLPEAVSRMLSAVPAGVYLLAHFLLWCC